MLLIGAKTEACGADKREADVTARKTLALFFFLLLRKLNAPAVCDLLRLCKAAGFCGAEISFEALSQDLIQTRLSKET